MQVFHRYTDLPESALRAVTAVGNFDGIHLGHQKILNEARAIARNTDKPFNVLTFEPHPRQFFNKTDAPFRITPIRTKTRLFASLGVDNLIIMHFTPEFRSMTGDEFVDNVLCNGLKVSHIVVGEGYAFGYNRSGSADLLKQKSKNGGFKVSVLENLCSEKEKSRYSSSLVRLYIARGDVHSAEKILGHHFEIEGRVVVGKKIGHTIGFPTANIATTNYVEPRHGVYAIRIGIPQKPTSKQEFVWYDGVANFGTRPTVNNGMNQSFEINIFNFNENIYGERVRVKFINFLRPELRLSSIEDLRKTINTDVRWAGMMIDTSLSDDYNFNLANS